MVHEKPSVLESIKIDDVKDFGQKKLETMFVRNGFALLRFTDKNLDVSKVLVVTMDDKKCQPFGESMDFYGSAKNENFQQACCSFYNTFKTHIKFYEEHNMVPDMVIKNGEALIMDISDMVKQNRKEHNKVSLRVKTTSNHKQNDFEK